MSLYLVDTSTSRDLYINDVLVNQGLALFVSDTTDDENGVELYGTEAPLEGVSYSGCGKGEGQISLFHSDDYVYVVFYPG